ncbi:hypothetical protein [Actinokineospora globicatena]|uniref:hypothetical protein n=1 Tax=Actinokineospora globicatena TaxID=103729 RepID=UPI0020A3942E|nr:hypothetical protein [Actinokineospora globicatena]MCP2306684.1 hypothetical protein [Actinokineospora globicatena]GLW82201.1 hypothetical protein Aglo01_66820 [Actinokineospora globicatena]GLW88994.1 hypothetical protein Aglo02_66330 [Actinokineospora globicatena]
MNRRRSTIAAAGLCGVVAAFQLALAAGAPLGRAAWGGTSAELPTGLRVASGVAVVLWAFAALVLLRRGGLDSPVPERVGRVGSWVVVALLAAGALMNAASSSPWERYGWAPVIVVHLVLCVRVATKPVPQPTA